MTSSPPGDVGSKAGGKAGLLELARSSGYTCGEFSLIRLAQDEQIYREYAGYLEAGRIPPGLQMDKDQVLAEMAELAASIEERDEKWRKYFYPAMRAVEHTGDVTVRSAKELTDDELAQIARGE